jgi:hypothetical protein
MNCYLCLVETQCASHPAFALCQQCGAGMCEKHLIELGVRPAGGGMISAGYRLLCHRCYRTAVPSVRPLQAQQRSQQRERGRSPGLRWWLWHWPHQPSALPQPEEAVAAVERFLQRQRRR